MLSQPQTSLYILGQARLEPSGCLTDVSFKAQTPVAELVQSSPLKRQYIPSGQVSPFTPHGIPTYVRLFFSFLLSLFILFLPLLVNKKFVFLNPLLAVSAWSWLESICSDPLSMMILLVSTIAYVSDKITRTIDRTVA